MIYIFVSLSIEDNFLNVLNKKMIFHLNKIDVRIVKRTNKFYVFWYKISDLEIIT